MKQNIIKGLLLLLLISVIPAGVYLAQHTQIFKSRASAVDSVVFTGDGITDQGNGRYLTSKLDGIRVKLTSPISPPKAKIKTDVSQGQVCDVPGRVPGNKEGYISNGILDESQIRQILNTDLTYHYDYEAFPQDPIQMIGKLMFPKDPSSLKVLMDNNLDNITFDSLSGWTLWSDVENGGGTVQIINSDPVNADNLSKGSYLQITNNSENLHQVSQTLKKESSGENWVLFGAWVRTNDPSAARIFLQSVRPPYQEFRSQEATDFPGQQLTGIFTAGGGFNAEKAGNTWTFVSSYAKVPKGPFNIVLRVSGQGKTVFFDEPAVALLDSDPNQTLANIINPTRCGATWFIGNEPGAEVWSGPNSYIEKTSMPFYALLYNQFYKLIKQNDPQASILPGGFTDTIAVNHPPVWQDTPPTLVEWIGEYKNLFGATPPMDAMNLHYYETKGTDRAANIYNGKGLDTFFSKVRQFMNDNGLQDKPIWITEIGANMDTTTASDGTISVSSRWDEGKGFGDDAFEFLRSNPYNITKWFWFDTCGNYDPYKQPLFEVERNSSGRVTQCRPALSAAGRAFALNALITSVTCPGAGQATIGAGEQIPVSINIKNTGGGVWDSNFRLGLRDATDPSSAVKGDRLSGLFKIGHLPLPESVNPGGTTTVNTTLTAPDQPGTYSYQWKMLREVTGPWFGNSSVTCNINVGAPVPPPQIGSAYNAQYVSLTCPTSMSPGSSLVNGLSITVKNTGNTVWPAGNGILLGDPSDTTTWGKMRVALTSDVPPGASYTFTSDITAPAAPGVYDFRWRMVQEGVQWFGDTTPDCRVTVSSPAVRGVTAAAEHPYTSSFKIAGNQAGLSAAPVQDYDTDPKYIDFTFSNKTPGTTETFFVEFKGKGGEKATGQATITYQPPVTVITAPSSAAPSSSPASTQAPASVSTQTPIPSPTAPAVRTPVNPFLPGQPATLVPTPAPGTPASVTEKVQSVVASAVSPLTKAIAGIPFVSGLVATPTPAPVPTPAPAPSPAQIPSIAPARTDFNSDSKVNSMDLSLLFSNWGKKAAQLKNQKPDLNSDGVINTIDYTLFLKNYKP